MFYSFCDVWYYIAERQRKALILSTMKVKNSKTIIIHFTTHTENKFNLDYIIIQNLI